MEKAISLFLCVTMLFVFGGCGASEAAYVCCSCRSAHEASRYSENYFLDYFRHYPLIVDPLDPLHVVQQLSYETTEAFYKAIEKGGLTKGERSRIAAEEHADKVGIPPLDAIRELYVGASRVPASVHWYGCSNFILFGDMTLDGQTVAFFLHHYGYRVEVSLPDGEVTSEIRDRISYSRVIDEDHTSLEAPYGPYTREYLLWEWTQGDYTYRVLESHLSEKAMTGEKQELWSLYHIEIEVEGDYYYLLLGYDEDMPRITLSPETVSEITLESVR